MTSDQACAHPNWAMGRKISVDSATMMNKALEVIEAYWLFNMELKEISVLLHPQSIVHSLVEYEDGSVLAQLSHADMRVPIAHALAWPERIPSGVNSLDLSITKRLDFEPICLKRYPALQLAYQAMQAGGTAMAILNAANEVAVEAFLNGHIAFTDIAHINEEVLSCLSAQPATTLEVILEADRAARVTTLKKLRATTD
jgi:1-deoxy-D-xylulose-5-phosphate reductoisomerase